MRAALTAVLALGLAAGAARAQAPWNVSPRLARAWSHPDTTVLVWVIGEPGTDLDSLAALVTRSGGTVRHLSRFVGAVSARVPGAALPALARGRGVRRVQALGAYFRRPLRPPPGGWTAAAPACLGPGCPPVRAALADTTYGPTPWVMQQLDIPALHRLGLTGAGVRIAVLDDSFDTAQPLLAGAQVLAQHDFVGTETQPNDASHGTAVWSLLAADSAGRLVGAAPAASYILATTEYSGSETRVEEDNWVAAVEMAESLSVNIISSSLGYLSFDNGFTYTPQQLNGDVGVTTIAADSAAARGTLVVVAVGNAGPSPGSLDTPADAKGIVAVGATDSLGDVAAFSSRGPTADGRIKPEVVAPGLGVAVAALGTGTVLEAGTSFAAPLVAGLAALVAGERPGRPAAELRQGLLDAASFRNAPDNTHGWGIPDALKLLAFPTGFDATAPLDSLTAITPTFAWTAGPAPGAVPPDTFLLQVALDSTFATVTLDTTVTDSSVSLPFALDPGTRIYWRAMARSPLGVAEWTRTIGPLVGPPWATLLTLNAPSGESIRDSQPLFAWHAPAVTSPPGPLTFDLVVFPASEGPGQPALAVSGLTDTLYRPVVPLEKNLPFRWQIVARLGPGDSAVTTSTGTFLVLDQAAPATTLLFQNFPNPFPNPALGVTNTCIWFDIATPGDVRLDVYDVRGHLVRRLVPSASLPAQLPVGRYGRPGGNALGTCDPRLEWDGRDDTGAYVRPGVYLYRLSAPGYQDTKRIVFLGAP